jgi:glycosyltransferase involved in cell wall biosynthesis
MKVAIIPPATRTGEWTLSRCLIRGLQQNDIDVKILQHFAFNRPNIRLFLGSLLLRYLIRDDSISVLHNVDNLGPFLFPHKDLALKKVLSVHDISPIILPQLFERRVPDRVLRFDFTTVLPKIIKNTDLVLVPSYSTREDLIARCGAKKENIVVTPFGVDTSFFYPREDYAEVLDKYRLRHKFLLYVGNDSPRKNLRTLVRAYADIFLEIPHDLVLVGPINPNRLREYINLTDLSPDLKKEVQGRIIVLGYVARDDLPNIYSAATAFVFPSLYEGFGLPPLEAMACGTISVVSRNSSLIEVMGNCGILIDDPLDPEEISARILEAIKEDTSPNDLVRRGLERAKKFTWEKTAQATIAAYHWVAQT